jgi:maltooligosyltrehalose synthase
MHGYDITNHEALNPEIGTEADHARLSALLREHGLGHLLDIVPNHMGIGGASNPWWMNVLENGPFVALRALLRHRLERPLAGPAGQGAPSRAGRPVRAACWRRAS